MQSSAATCAAPIPGPDAAQHPQPLPAWIESLDRAIIVLLNVALVAEVILVFVNTMVRTLFNSSALMGVDEASPLFLITLAFMGRSVASSRGQFIAITLLATRAPRAWNEFFKAVSEWVLITVPLLIGGYSI